MEKQKTSSKRKAATKVIMAVLLVAIMTGISFAVANFVHNRKSVQASSVKNGLSAYELAVQQGYAGSLDDWLVSLQGKSAYQIAVDNGYSGSEKDWSKTLTAMSKKDKSDISSAAFSEKGDLVITLSDGTKINVGKAVGASGKDGKDGIGIKSAKINDKGELIISYSDGNSVNLDKVVGETVNNGVGIASSIINEKGELVLTYTNGEAANLGGVVGADGRDGKDGRDGTDGTNGTDGISVAAAVINESDELIITYSDGKTANLGKIVGSDGINGVNGTNGTDGKDGKDGISVSSAEINSEGELVLSFSNGQRANVGAVVGAKGDKGDKGEQGLQGAQGEKGENGLNGSDGIGVKKSEINSAGELVITYTNDLTENLGPVVGAKGDKGDKGDQGVQGEKGDQGVQGEKGDAGLNGTDGVGINNIEISNDGNLLITLTNGTSLNLGNIKGAKGDQGIQGEKGDKGDAGLGGADGKDGTNGTDGVGVASSEINTLGELVITYSDGNTVNLGKVVGNDGAQGAQGEKGEKGDKGDQGIQGEKGEKGDQGIQGEKGDKGDQGVQGEKGDAGINGTNGADGVGITDVTINADNELVLSFSNGNIINLGNIKGSKGDKGDKGDSGLNGKDGVGIQNVDVSADGALTVTLTNGTVLNLGNIKGADGLGITKAEINTSGELVLTYSNGDVKNLGKVSGENGKDGANGADGLGIKSLTLSPDGELVVTMSDNSISNLGNIKGEKGDKGEQGQQGLQGSKGADGRGIAKTELVNGELVITYTDGTSDNLGSVSGTGEKEYLIYSSVVKDGEIYAYRATLNPLYANEVRTIEIPAQHNGLPVIELGFGISTQYVSENGSYSNNIVSTGTTYGFSSTSLEEIIIPESVTKICTWYFWNCYNLKRVVFKDPTGWVKGTNSSSPIVKDIPEEDMKNPEKCKDIIKAYDKAQYVLYKDL